MPQEFGLKAVNRVLSVKRPGEAEERWLKKGYFLQLQVIQAGWAGRVFVGSWHRATQLPDAKIRNDATWVSACYEFLFAVDRPFVGNGFDGYSRQFWLFVMWRQGRTNTSSVN